jgi:hypothetical protein
VATIATVVKDYGRSVAAPWRQSGVFTVSLSSFSGLQRQAAHDVGFRAVAVQLANAPWVSANMVELAKLRDEYRNRGWSIVGWGTFGQGTDPKQDGSTAARLVREFRLDGWVANGESWAEGSNAWKSAAFVDSWRASSVGTPPLMLSCLSSVTGVWPREMDFHPWIDYPGCAISPQVYSSSQPLYTLPAMRASFRQVVPLTRVMPTLEVRNDKPVPTRYMRWRGPRWLWTGDSTKPDQFGKVLVS